MPALRLRIFLFAFVEMGRAPGGGLEVVVGKDTKESIMKLNKEELLIGAIFAASFALFTGWWCLFTIPACAFFWAMGGSRSKLWRRIGVPVVFTAALFLEHGWWGFPLICGPLMFLALSIGYGIPSMYPYDEGSVMGRFIFNILFDVANDDEAGWVPKVASLWTRFGFYSIITFALLPLGLLISPMGFMSASWIFVLTATFVPMLLKD